MPPTTRATTRRTRAALTQPACKTARPAKISKKKSPTTVPAEPLVSPSNESGSKAVERLPCKYLKMEDFPEFNEGAKPPRRIYGWMFDDSYMLALASRRGLSFEPGPHTRRLLGGHETFNFSDLTEEHFRNEQLMRSLQSTAEWVVLLHFKSQTGLSFQVESAASPYKRVLVAWTNYDMGTTYASYDERRVGGWKSVMEFLDKEMNECLPSGTGRCELVWWWPTLLSRS